MDTQDQRSTWRRELSELAQRLGVLVDSLETHLPTLAGVVNEQHTRCGKPHCICVREGRLHATWCVSFLQGSRRCHRAIPPEALEKIQTLAARYRTLRQQRAEMNRLFDGMREIFDRLERSLRIPASQLLPKVRRSGRSRNGGK